MTRSGGNRLVVRPLTRDAFAPFGDVIEPASAKQVYAINAGTAQRYHDVATIDVANEGGRPLVSIFRAQPRELPFVVESIERHPLGSQAFVPLGAAPYLVVVATDPSTAPCAFHATGGQGVNYRRGTWHHALIALGCVSDFLVIDRGGAGDNCDEVTLAQAWIIDAIA